MTLRIPGEKSKTCKKCGETKPQTEFYASAGMRDGFRNECKDCLLATHREWYHRNRSYAIRKAQEWRNANRDRALARERAFRERNRELLRQKDRRRWLRAKYGLTPEQFDAFVRAQKGRCAICGTELGKNLHVDHDHELGEVRGLLCGSCNRAIGLLKEDPGVFRSAELYLLRSRQKQIELPLGRQ